MQTKHDSGERPNNLENGSEFGFGSHFYNQRSGESQSPQKEHTHSHAVIWTTLTRKGSELHVDGSPELQFLFGFGVDISGFYATYDEADERCPRLDLRRCEIPAPRRNGVSLALSEEEISSRNQSVHGISNGALDAAFWWTRNAQQVTTFLLALKQLSRCVDEFCAQTSRSESLCVSLL